ncbi:MAG: hypothetical protein JXA98_00645 [Methanosarcinaceae archaeon]|nr:hypothetical protein [Methanosarcinaceae archaeon]
MSTENRDLIIERLERQLVDKEREYEEIKASLRDSILRELRRELQNDLDLNNRISKLEQKLTELTNNVTGIMDELLDQKTVLRSASRILDKSENTIRSQLPSAIPEPRPAPAPPVSTPPPELPAYMKSPFPKPRQPASSTTVQTRDVPISTSRKPQTNVHLNIRDAAPRPEPRFQEPEPKTEYIVARSDKRSNESSPHLLQKHHTPSAANTGEYIIAEDRKNRRTVSHTPYEDTESREDEDVEITTTRSK